MTIQNNPCSDFISCPDVLCHEFSFHISLMPLPLLVFLNLDIFAVFSALL